MASQTKEFDKKQFEALCGMWATQSEICSFFNTTDKTLSKWCIREYGLTYSEVYKKYAEVGNVSLRRAQLKKALEGNTTMLIWLGKQYLNQTDKVENTNTHEIEDLSALADILR